MKLILENKTLTIASIFSTVVILFTLGFGFYLQSKVPSISVWYSIYFAGVILITFILFYKVGVENGKLEGFLEDWKPK